MKKIHVYVGMGACLALCMLVACAEKPSYSKPAQKSNKQESSEQRLEPEAMNPINAANTPGGVSNGGENGEKSCQSDDDCVLMPENGCFGCMKKGGSHKAVNKAFREEFLKANMQSCLAQIKKDPPNGEYEKNGSCAMTGTKCNNGLCELKVQSQEEKQADLEKMKKEMQAQRMAQSGQGHNMGR